MSTIRELLVELTGTVEYADRSEETLRDHLLWQLELENLDPRTTAIGQAVIDGRNRMRRGSRRHERYEDGETNDPAAAI